jgi:hypothetical protein
MAGELTSGLGARDFFMTLQTLLRLWEDFEVGIKLVGAGAARVAASDVCLTNHGRLGGVNLPGRLESVREIASIMRR